MLQFIILAVVVSTASADVRLDTKHFESCDTSTGAHCSFVYTGLPIVCKWFGWRADPRDAVPWIQLNLDATYKVVGVIYEMASCMKAYFKDTDVIFDNQVSRSILLEGRDGEQDFKIDPPVDSSSVKFVFKSAYSRTKNGARRIYVKVDSEVPVGPAPTGRTPVVKTTTAPVFDPKFYQLKRENFKSCGASSGGSFAGCECLFTPKDVWKWVIAPEDKAPWVEFNFDGLYDVVGIRFTQANWRALFKDAEIILDNRAPIKVVLFRDTDNNDFIIDPPAPSDSVKVEFKSTYSWGQNGGKYMAVFAKEALKLPPQIQLIPDKTVSCSSSSHINSSHSCEIVYPEATKGTTYGWIVNSDDKDPWIEFKFDDTYEIREVQWGQNKCWWSYFKDVEMFCDGKAHETIALVSTYSMVKYPIYPPCSASTVKFVTSKFHPYESYESKKRGAREIIISGNAKK